MTDNKTIGINALVTLGIITLAMITPGFFDETKYTCDSRPELGVVHCDNFSKYVDPNGKCIRNDNTNLICRDGWKLVIDDTEMPEESIPIEDDTNNINYVQKGKQYLCNTEGCECIKGCN